MFLPSPGWLSPGPMQPFVQMGENVLVRRLQRYIAYKVAFIEQLPMSGALQIDFGAVGAAATVAGVSLQTQLEMDGYEMGQFRCRLLEDMSLQVYEPQQTPRYLVKNGRARWTKISQKMDPWGVGTEICVFQDQWPYVDVTNHTAVAYTVCRASFWGYRFQVNRYVQATGPDGKLTYRAVSPLEADNSPGASFGSIREALESGIKFTAVMAEGFIGLGYERLPA